jgi:eIF-2B alpha/beta/delta-like uncharacterized protein
MKNYIDTILQEIQEDRTTGAVELVKKGVDTIALFISNFSGDSSLFFHELIRISKILIDSQPTMAPFFNLANVLLLSAEDRQDLEEMKQRTKNAIKEFVLHIQSAAEQVSKIARGLIPEGSRVLTHSYSSTVLRILTDMKEEGKRFEVICTESRPMYEGFQLAKKLNESHIKVQLLIDSAAADTMKEVDLVLVGADCLTPLGLVNKVGTYGLALSAKEKGIPFYALCGTDKLLGVGMANKFRLLRRDPREVWPNVPEGVEVVNYYFDTTPLEYLRAIVTEEGIMSRTEILRRFKNMRVSKYFPM